MTDSGRTRRSILVSAAALAATAALPAFPNASTPLVHVVKDPNCGCCTAWIEILHAEGFDVRTEDASAEALAAHKQAKGIPAAMVSCHTAEVDGYMIEGHVPAADIRRLLDERPAAVGLAVPGMPYGSPGMGPEEARDAYDVFLILQDGSTEVFASYEAA